MRYINFSQSDRHLRRSNTALYPLVTKAGFLISSSVMTSLKKPVSSNTKYVTYAPLFYYFILFYAYVFKSTTWNVLEIWTCPSHYDGTKIPVSLKKNSNHSPSKLVNHFWYGGKHWHFLFIFKDRFIWTVYCFTLSFEYLNRW